MVDMGNQLNVRVADSGDAESLLELFGILDSETSFMLLEPGERSTTVGEQRNYIRQFADSPHQLMCLAEDGESITGFLIANGGGFARNKHTASIVIGVRQDVWGKGIGKALMHFMESWARQTDIHRLELTVMENNAQAIAFYRKSGFIEEGVRLDSLKIEGAFVSEIYMRKILKS